MIVDDVVRWEDFDRVISKLADIGRKDLYEQCKQWPRICVNGQEYVNVSDFIYCKCVSQPRERAKEMETIVFRDGETLRSKLEGLHAVSIKSYIGIHFNVIEKRISSWSSEKVKVNGRWKKICRSCRGLNDKKTEWCPNCGAWMTNKE